MNLFRPVGVRELDLIVETGYRRFPPRLKEQPYFYPVLNLEYARQIAKEWNTRTRPRGTRGFESWSGHLDHATGLRPQTTGRNHEERANDGADFVVLPVA